MTRKHEIERRMMRFEQGCRSAGIKLTHQRMEIFREVAQGGDHPDVETVYRALWLLSDFGLIATLGPPRERTRFDANLSRHHHFVCLQCGLIRDFYSDAFDELRLPQSIKAIGRVETTHVEARGVCRECVKTNKAKPTTTRGSSDIPRFGSSSVVVERALRASVSELRIGDCHDRKR